MKLEIRPEPTEAERAAIEAAVKALRHEDGGRGPWWTAGVWENLDADLDGADGIHTSVTVRAPHVRFSSLASTPGGG